MTNQLAALVILIIVLASGCTSQTIPNNQSELDTQPANPAQPNPVYPQTCKSTVLINESCVLFVESTFVDTVKCPGRSQEPSIGIEYESFSYDEEALSLERTSFTSGCETTVYQKLVPKTKGSHTIVGHLVTGQNVTMGITIT